MRLGSIGVTQTGSTPSTQVQDFYGDYMPFIKPADITNSGIDYNNEKLSKKGTEVGRVAKKGSILMVCIGGSLGKCYFNDRIVSFNQQINSLTPFFSSYKFIFYYLLSSYFFEQLQDKATGTATPIVNKTSWESILIPLPPLPEQKRIVDKLEEILPLVEKYKEDKERLDELNLSFAPKLKKSILDYAIKGKLVEQNLEDESVEILLQKIRQEKQRLVKDKKLKADKFPQSTIFVGEDNSPYEKIGKETHCIADEIPFEIPSSWAWVRLGEISYIVGSKNNQVKAIEIKKYGDFPVVSQSQNLIDGYSSESQKLIKDIPLVMFGDHTRNVKYIDFNFIIGADGTKFHKCVIVEPKFLFYWMKFASEKLKNRGYARHYTLLKSQFIPLPPLPEQKRIVAKIEELLKFVDILQSSLK